MLANNRNRLSRGDVVAGIPILFAGSIEVLFNNLLPPRSSVPSAHRRASLSQDVPKRRQLPFLIGMPGHRQRITTFA
jgi:hypothetical protein